MHPGRVERRLRVVEDFAGRCCLVGRARSGHSRLLPGLWANGHRVPSTQLEVACCRTTSVTGPSSSWARVRPGWRYPISCSGAGVDHVVLERGEEVGASWRRFYTSLVLHTGKHLSSLPDLPFGRGDPLFIAPPGLRRLSRPLCPDARLPVRQRTEVVAALAPTTVGRSRPTSEVLMRGCWWLRPVSPVARVFPRSPGQSRSPAQFGTRSSIAIPTVRRSARPRRRGR